MSATNLTNWNQLSNHRAYKAQWTPNNAHLQSNLCAIWCSKHLSLCQKICLLFKRILEAVVRFFTPASFQRSVQGAVISSSRTAEATIQDQFNVWKTENTGPFTRYCLDLTTPDKQPIHAVFYARDDVKRDLPTVVYFQGMNGQVMDQKNKPLEFFTGPGVPPCNVILFDYRASGVNRLLYGERCFTARDLILDGDTVVQAAIHTLGISEKNILFFGVSFGGALAAFVAHMYSAGRFVSYNSFSSLASVLNSSIPIRQNYELLVLHADNRCPWSGLRRVSAQRALRLFAALAPYWGWDLEPRNVLPAMHKRTLCVHHPGDTFIPPSCAAFNALPPSSRCLSKVIPSKTITDGLALHMAKPDELVTQDGDIPMTKKLTQFLFGENGAVRS